MQKWTILILFLILIAGITISYQILKPEKKLKIFCPADLNSKLVDESLQNKKVNHRISDFSLYNQNGEIITQKNFDGKIYVADFFFVSCQTICPKMSIQMQRVYEYYKNKNEIICVSHTVLPEEDSVAVLAEYAKKLGANSDKWIFLTGNKKQIYELARKSYFAVTTDGSGDTDDFIHTENFILIDKQKQIRGFYDGTNEKDVDRLMEEIEILLEE